MSEQLPCKHLVESLSDYVDGTLDENLCSELERHLRECEDCRVVVDTLRKTIDLYHHTNPTPSMPVEVRDRLYQRLNLESFLKKRG